MKANHPHHQSNESKSSSSSSESDESDSNENDSDESNSNESKESSEEIILKYKYKLLSPRSGIWTRNGVELKFPENPFVLHGNHIKK